MMSRSHPKEQQGGKVVHHICQKLTATAVISKNQIPKE